MRIPALFILFLSFGSAGAQPCTIHLDAPSLAGKVILLQRYDDLFTLRTITMDRVRIDAEGKATLTAAVDRPVKGSMRTMDQRADLYLVPGGTYRIRVTGTSANKPRSLGGVANMKTEFIAPDHFDLNILLGDLNERLDSFVAEDLATDEVAGMQALEVVRKEGDATDRTGQRPPTLFLTPNWSKARVDSFETKLKRFYAEVEDTLFWHHFDLAVGGLRLGPQSSKKELFDRYVRGKPAAQDNVEYVRFVRTLFQEHLIQDPFRKEEVALKRAIKLADIDTLRAILRGNDLLATDEVLCELVLMDGLYSQYHGNEFDREGMLACLEKLSTHGVHEANRRIAGNMVHDLTSMTAGAALPHWELPALDSGTVFLDKLPDEAHCIVVTASWCSHCDLELTALAKLLEDYGAYVKVLVIGMDADVEDTRKQRARHALADARWVHAGDDPAFMDALRLRSLPAVFLSNGSTLARSPAEMPSRGLGASLHAIKVSKPVERPGPGGPPPTPAPR